MTAKKQKPRTVVTGRGSKSATSQQSKAARKKTTRKRTPSQLMHRDAARSGLTAVDFKKLGIKVLTPEANNKLTGHNVPGYLIPYFNVDGKPIPNGWRARHLEDIPGPFGAKREKPIRYTGPKGEQPHLFFPKNFKGWKQVAKDVTEPVFITEGEKKAACMCKHGFATMAVPGVWGWRSKDRGIDLLPEFDLIDWGDADNPRVVIMVFDNDIIVKEQVLHAVNALSRKLTKKGGRVLIKHLPPGDLKGADDFLTANGADAFDSLPEELFAESGALCEFQEKVAYIENGNFFSDVQPLDGHATLRTFPKMTDLRQAYGNLSYIDLTGDEPKTRYVVDEWLKFPNRRTHTCMTFAPGQGPVIDNKLNTWRGWGVELKPGTVKPFLDLVNFVFAAEPQAIEPFMQWLAYPMQHPGTKLLWHVLIWSQAQGVGKTLIGEIIRSIYGDANASRIEKDDITDSWNDWLTNKQFILGEEITGGDSRQVGDKVKNMATRTTVLSKVKFQASYALPDFANYFLTSNHEDSLYLEADDRRWLVIHVDGGKRPPEFYDGIAKWWRNDGAAHLFHYLTNDVDCTGFNPNGEAPRTTSKEDMQDLSKSDLDMFACEVRDNPDAVLKLGKLIFSKDLYISEEIRSFAKRFCGGRDVSKIAVSKALIRALFERRRVQTKTGTILLYALRNREAWKNRPSSAWGDSYDKSERKKYAESGNITNKRGIN